MKHLLILFILVALSCDQDENSNQPSPTALGLVTGINLRQNFDDQQYQLGNPNTLVNNKFIIYPNPATQMVVVSAQENVTDIWVVPASAEKIFQDENFSNILSSNLYSQESISTSSSFSITGQSADFFTLDIGNLEKGYYKVFVKINGEIFWDNLYKYDEQQGNEEQFNELNDFWN
ncbi:MAG TPA: hypothetical protein VFQ50_07345 [Flavobacterium sp.]|jgi:hypothetical protein|nr:hypothetical protein [Flavobacterium sp.]